MKYKLLLRTYQTESDAEHAVAFIKKECSKLGYLKFEIETSDSGSRVYVEINTTDCDVIKRLKTLDLIIPGDIERFCKEDRVTYIGRMINVALTSSTFHPISSCIILHASLKNFALNSFPPSGNARFEYHIKQLNCIYAFKLIL